MCTSLQFCIRDRPEKYSYYMDQVLNFKLYGRHIHTVIVVSIFLLQVYVTFSCSSRFDWQNQLFSENSSSEELASYWLLTLYVTSFSWWVKEGGNLLGQSSLELTQRWEILSPLSGISWGENLPEKSPLFQTLNVNISRTA